jgi:hypothetical protein
MIDHRRHHFSMPGFAVAGLLLLGAGGLGGCAALGDSAASVAFVDPAKYALYDCKRIDADRKALAARTADLKSLMAKAETGAGGVVVAEVAYGNDLVTVRAQARAADQAWHDNKCTDAGVTAASVVSPSPGSPNPGPRGPASPSPAAANAPRSDSAVY